MSVGGTLEPRRVRERPMLPSKSRQRESRHSWEKHFKLQEARGARAGVARSVIGHQANTQGPGQPGTGQD